MSGYIVIITLLLFIIIFYQINNTHNLLSGFWEADSDFCEESGLDIFCIQISDQVDWNGKRACYLLAHQGDDFIMNDPISVQFKLSPIKSNNWSLDVTGVKHFDVNFSDIEYTSFPNRQKARFYPLCNKLVLYDGDTITAVLYKNSSYTESKFINDQEQKELDDSEKIGD